MSFAANSYSISTDSLVRHCFLGPQEKQEQRVRAANQQLLSPYRIKVYRDDGEYTLGRFSSQFLFGDQNFVRYLEVATLKVGSFVQSAGDVQILCGGEHFNGQPINVNLATVNMELAMLAGNDGATVETLAYGSKGDVVVGNNVIISSSVRILSGVTIGNGAVIGAGAVVTKDVPPFSIIAGNPARMVRHRFDQATINRLEKCPWWDLSYEWLVQNIGEAYKLSAEAFVALIERSAEPVFDRHAKKYVAIGLKNGQISPMYFFDGTEKRNVTQKYVEYFQQSSTDRIRVDANVLYEL
jgi:acetyltransferase-like isoleucine patch superfamily enzyme